ncbi:MAG TPA: hypothetical protein DCL77_05585 [Prolixibacteraceae bacterium]|nr:hypothetical protein [Prolixibacteraceae bacterium]
MKVTSKSSDGKEKADTNNSYPDYPTYPPEEDIYSNYTEEQEIDPEQTSRLKEPVILSDLINQLDFRKELSADELDIPGTELDDSQEILGSEDEENNYYSLGGDDHDDLDEVGDEGISGA